MRKYILLLLTVTLPLYALDQFTKLWVLGNIEFEGGRSIIPGFFDLVHFHNTGAAFSMFSNSNIQFMVLSVVALIILTVIAVRQMMTAALNQFGWALLLSGILGNLTDRIWHGYVVDFLLFDLHVPFAHPWPAFNVADACICTATGLFLLQSFRETKAAK
jgi:signal peptidase II